MNYTFRQLLIFTKVCETNNITKAAELLHLTQPAVSIQLKNFQDQFNMPLTEVIGRKLYVTDFGHEIYEAALSILAETDKIEQTARAYEGDLVGKLKIATVSTGKYIMPFMLAPFLEEHRSVELQMDVTNRSNVIDSLMNNQLDFALVSLLPENIAVDSIELMQNELYLVGNKSTPLERATHPSSILTQIPLIYREQGSGTRQTMERFIKQEKLNVKPKLELTSNEAVKQAVLAGLGYSIMPKIGIKSELKTRDISILKVEGLPVTTSWQLIWLKDKKFSMAAKSYLEFIENNKSVLLKKYNALYD